MSFKITIEETKVIKQFTGGKWDVVGEKEVLRETGMFDAKIEGDPKTRMEKVYGHTPQIETQVSVTKDILVQVVETLDFAAVIKAINKL